MRRALSGRVTEIVPRGTFVLRRWDLEWFYQDQDGAGVGTVSRIAARAVRR
ncbi:MAG TPA: hypothetical protein VIC29_01880 [Steroidobacteraceae bacterium]